jgi:hypothetical protein
MPGRLDVLAFLQESASKLRQMARERPSSISPEMMRIADDIAHEASRLEAELMDAGLLGAGMDPGPMRPT